MSDWTERAACRGVDARGRRLGDLFFPPYGERPEAAVVREARAKRICASCPVLTRCQIYARDEIHGIWAGLTPEERGWHGRQYPRRAV